MKHFVFLAVCLGAVASVRADGSITIRPGSYAAIAYSPSTGKYRYAYNYGSRSTAENAARTNVGTDDAKVVCWTSEGFCALALGDDKTAYGVGWRFGAGASNTEAMKEALANCNARTTNARVAVCISTDGQYVYQPQPKAEKKDPPPKAGDSQPPRAKVAVGDFVSVKWKGNSYFGTVIKMDAFGLPVVRFTVNGEELTESFLTTDVTKAIVNPEPSAVIQSPGKQDPPGDKKDPPKSDGAKPAKLNVGDSVEVDFFNARRVGKVIEINEKQGTATIEISLDPALTPVKREFRFNEITLLKPSAGNATSGK